MTRATLKEATSQLNAFTDDLERVVVWRDDLASRLWRAQVRFEYIGLDRDEQDRLTDEVHAFTAVCPSIADSVTGNGSTRDRLAS